MMATHPLTKTSNIMLSRSHMANTEDWHPSNVVMTTPLKSCKRLSLMLCDDHQCRLKINSLYHHKPLTIIS